MIKEPYWLVYAKKLPLNRTTKIPCCKDDNSMSITHTSKGYMGYCHRCGETVFEPHGELSIKQIQAYKDADKELQQKIAMPTDATTAMPDKAYGWFLKYGISICNAVSIHSFKYSPSSDRVIMPIWHETNGQCVGLQSRYVGDLERPKYLLTGDRNVLYYPLNATQYFDNLLVITEDILSAIKVKTVADAVSTLGTNVTTAQLSKIYNKAKNKTVVIWYDADEAGIKGTNYLTKALTLMGVQVKVIRTNLDPKEYSTNVIKDKLKLCLM